MCNNCKLREGLAKLLDKYDLWTSHWSHVMSDEDVWTCEEESEEDSKEDEEESEDESEEE
jgi:hypothetical protein